MVYKFRPGSRISGIKAQIVGEVLQRLRKENGGILETETVLKEARKKRSELHPAFEWDNDKASHEYRLIQARQLIRALVVIDSDEPAFVHVSSPKLNYYQSTEVAARNVDEWDIVHANALRSLKSASENLERLDQVAQRVAHESSAAVSEARNLVHRAQEQLAR